MYLRETKRRNADGTSVSCLALAQNERDPATGVPRARIIHRFGRADHVDREALARLVRSISRFLDPDPFFGYSCAWLLRKSGNCESSLRRKSSS